MSTIYKIPQSVLVVIYTQALDVLLLRRLSGGGNGEPFWQSVTGSKDRLDEPWDVTARREVREETGIDCLPEQGAVGVLQDWQLENVYTIYPQWRARYAPGVVHNTEHLFGLQLAERCAVRLSPTEHSDYQWLPFREAADCCVSPSNAEAILQLPRLLGATAPGLRVTA